MSIERYLTFIRHTPEGIWRLGLDTPIDCSLPAKEQVKLILKYGYIAQANEAFAVMSGVNSPTEIIGFRISDYFKQQGAKDLNDLYTFVASNYRLRGSQTHRTDESGKVLHFRNSLTGETQNGKLLYAWATQHDITDYHQATEALQRSEERLALALKASNLGHWEWMIETDTYIWSDKIKSLLGVGADDTLNYKKFLKLVHPSDKIRTRNAINKALENGGEYQVEHRVVWSDGSEHWILSQGRAYQKDQKSVRVLGTCMNIDYRKLYEIRLHESEERFRTMADTAPVMIWVVDNQKKTVYFNKPWFDFTGHTLEEDQGDGWEKSIHPEDLTHFHEVYDRAFEKREPFMVEYRLRRHDGVYRLLLDTAAPRFSADNDFLGYVGSSIDIEDIRQTKQQSAALKEINQKLRLQRKQLVALNKSKDEFISLASHQLRTPATGVKQYIAMLIDGYAGDMNEAQKHMLQTAYDSNDRQLTIINDLLRVAQLDAGKVILKKTPTDMSELVGEVIEEQSGKFKSKKQSLSYNHPKNPVYLDVDPNKMKMVIDNLLDNASKYTPNGKSVSVKLRVKPASVKIHIDDQGIGMSEESMSHLFQKFSRLDNTQGLAVEGSGLGLYWAKKIIMLHKGTLKVVSEAGKGSSFTITLPKKNHK